MNNSEKEILFNEPSDEIFNMLEDPDYKWGTHFLSPFATEADRVKYQLCKDIYRFREEHNLTNEEIAERLGIDLNQVLKIIYRHYDELNFEELSNYNEKLAASVQTKVHTYYANTYIPNNYYASSGSSNKSYKL